MGEWQVAWAGQLDPDILVSSVLDRRPVLSVDAIGKVLARRSGNFAFIAENPRHVVAGCDRVRGYPIFHGTLRGATVFSNSARDLRLRMGSSGPNHVSLLEGLMAGYVTDNHTLASGLHQLRPAEVMIADKVSGNTESGRFYEFLPREHHGSEEDLLRQLSEITKLILRRVIEYAGGRVIVVPLSGGLDSRLVLAMLHALGYRHLRAISYGPANNHEAERARRVAEALQVPWTFQVSTRRSARKIFNSSERRRYWASADGLASVPNMQEFQVFSELKASRALPEDAVIVNGQSGDFISGGHIPSSLLSPAADDDTLFEAVVEKHLSLWRMMKTAEHLSALRERFDSVLAPVRQRGYGHPASLFEYWGWQERQSKYVVNQQRTYDFFDLDWYLPLWDREYCDFWRGVPLHLREGQRLYRRYLEEWDYYGLFTEKKLRNTSAIWPGWTRAVPLAARSVGLLAGPTAKRAVYQRFKYLGYYRHQLAAYPFAHFLKRADDFRNPVSLFAETWIRELYPDWLEQHFPYGP